MDVVINILLALALLGVTGAICGALCSLFALPAKTRTKRKRYIDNTENDDLVAFVKCRGTDVSLKYTYAGENDCRSATMLAGGAKECPFSCLGLGSCAAVCPEGAISVNNGVAEVDTDKCIACGKCVSICPRGAVELVPISAIYKVACGNRELGMHSRKNCEVGCIGCLACVKNCKYGAVSVENNLAVIDYSKCKSCGKCAAVCPRGIITAPPQVPEEESFDESEYFSLKIDDGSI